jgi:hypothetical protein
MKCSPKNAPRHVDRREGSVIITALQQGLFANPYAKVAGRRKPPDRRAADLEFA